MESDFPGTNAGKNRFRGEFIRLHGARILPDRGERMGIGAGDHRFAVLLGPA